MKTAKKITLVLPCYNEEKNIEAVYAEILKHCQNFDLEVIFVDDGSRDKTAEVILKLKEKDPRVKLISFVSNAGHQLALRAGIVNSTGDYVISLDADLQHPPSYIPCMIEKAEEGYDCIHMVRRQKQEGFLKNILSSNFYKFFSWVSGVPIVEGASDFRLLSKRIQNVVQLIPERNLFLRALIPYLGFKSYNLEYDLGTRLAGEPSYTFKKSLKLAKDALLNYTSFPASIFFKFGIVVACFSAFYGMVHVFLKIFTDINEPGFTDIVASVLFLGSLNLILFAVIGKYLQTILDYLRNRPEYLIDAQKEDPLVSHKR